jgi:EAL domain-containing protein (putative c-di-GMP-specific phosphodiesterase class I)/ActR/RegA family two-component response regulator
VPQVRVTNIDVNNKALASGPIAQRERIELGHDENDVTLSFVATDFHQPAKNRFRYRLGGSAYSWLSTDRNSVTLAKLAPGAHRFEVLGSNNDAVWSSLPATLDIVVRPPWWRTSLASLLYAIALACAVLLYHHAQRSKLRRERQFNESLADAHSLAEAHRQMALRHAQFDDLTQLPNRASLLEALERYLRFARARRAELAVVLLVLAAWRIPSQMIELELTESALMENVEHVSATMQALKALGVSLALDDFGVGYSSLSYLKRLPLDKIKIDRSFVCEITESSDDAAIVRAVIAMSHQLQMTVLAEGVETQAQLGYLRRNHCDHCQGMFFGMPQPAMAAERLLRQRYLSTEAFQATRPTRTLLLLDDEENVRHALIRLLRPDGYRVLAAANATEAFAILGREDVQVVLADQRMPHVSGTEFLTRVKAMYPDTVRLILSGYTDLATVTEAINRGAIYKFLTKPWEPADLRAQIGDAFRTHSERKVMDRVSQPGACG